MTFFLEIENISIITIEIKKNLKVTSDIENI